MLKKGILNPNIARVLASTGHTDMLVVTDAGLPIPEEIERVDLSILPNMPRFLDLLKAIIGQLVIEKIIMSEEIKEKSPDMLVEIMKLFPEDIEVEFMPHTDFKQKTKSAKAAFRSGEFTPYANIILVAGVAY
jgi:D-ribose pyranase